MDDMLPEPPMPLISLRARRTPTTLPLSKPTIAVNGPTVAGAKAHSAMGWSGQAVVNNMHLHILQNRVRGTLILGYSER